MEKWTHRIGEELEWTYFGPNLAFAHYQCKLPIRYYIFFHSQFSLSIMLYLLALKELSRCLCVSTIAQMVNFVVLVNKSFSMVAFGSGIRGQVLTYTMLIKSEGNVEPLDILGDRIRGWAGCFSLSGPRTGLIAWFDGTLMARSTSAKRLIAAEERWFWATRLLQIQPECDCGVQPVQMILS